MAGYLEKIDEALRTPGKIDEIATLLEQKTKVQRKHLGLGALVIGMGLVLTTLAPLVVNVLAFAYPAFKSIKVNFIFIKPVGAGASKLGRFSPFSIKMKMFPSTNFYDKTIKITAINFSIDYG